MPSARAAPACALAAVAATFLSVAGPVRAAPPSAVRAAVEEDAARAFAAARERGALVLVDVWAPW